MGRKNKNRNDDDGGDEHREGNFATGFVSAKAVAAKEAAEAQRGDKKGKGADDFEGSDDEGQIGAKLSKKQAKKRRQQAQEDAEFGGDAAEQIGAKAQDTNAKQNDDSDGPGAQDLQKAMEENFEGAGAKRNTRKKKNKQQNMFEGADDAFAGVFDEGADSDEIQGRKGGNKNKKDRQQGKKKKKQESDHEADEPEEEEKVAKDQPEEDKEEGEAPLYPINMVYCAKCNMPPEYCSFATKDIAGCKEWLRSTHPVMFKEIYDEEADGEGDGDKDKKEESKGTEEEKKEGEEEAEPEKPKKKVKFNKEVGIIQVHKQKRGGKKVICQILGFEHYTKDLKGLASKFGKKFSCGCNVATDEILGDCISVQGDIEDRLIELMETDKDLLKLEVPIEKIRFEDMGNKKGRKRG